MRILPNKAVFWDFLKIFCLSLKKIEKGWKVAQKYVIIVKEKYCGADRKHIVLGESMFYIVISRNSLKRYKGEGGNYDGKKSDFYVPEMFYGGAIFFSVFKDLLAERRTI